VTVALPSAATRLGAAAACVAAVTGAGIAIRHLWVKAHPEISCGIDPLETSLNKVFIADWIPALFQADGLCTTEYDPILGLSIPQWALAWFTVFALVTAALALRKRHSA
jgi:disulfide bond formation protein DsbB